METTGKRLWGLLCVALLLTFLAGCSGGDSAVAPVSKGTPPPTPVTLTSIEVAPASPFIAMGTSRQFTATGVYSDNSKQDITASVTWASSNTAVATVGTTGLAAAVGAGTTIVTATSGSLSASTTLTVTTATLASIGVTPPTPSIALGTTQQFTAIGVFSDSSTQDLTTQVTWSSSATGIATVNSKGLAASVATGSATITATLGGVSGSTTLAVTTATLASIEVTPTASRIASGTTQQFKATGLFSDGTKQDITAAATWSSATPSVASIDSGGRATGVAAGTSVITASFGGISGTTALTVTAATLVAIEVSPLNPSIALGTSQQFTAIGRFSDNSTQDLTFDATWSSASAGVATISNAAGSNGLATSLATGSTTIVASSGSVTGSTTLAVTAATLVSIDVEPSTPSVPAGMHQQFTATGTFSDNTVQDLTTTVTWSSSVPSVATISSAGGSAGLALTVTTGTTTIAASFRTIAGSTVSGSTQLTVTNAALASIEVTPPDPSIPAGQTQQFVATGIFSDGSTFDLTMDVTWSSLPKGVATISNDTVSAGLATAVSSGVATISAKLGAISSDTTASSATLTVSAAALASITISPVNASIASGTIQQFTATGTYSDNSTRDVTQFATWISSSPAVAVISNARGYQGTATGVGVGSTTITAAWGTVVSNSATLTVTSATLQSITITPANATMAVKTNLQFTATGNFSDSTTQDLTKLVTWASSDKAIAAISNASGSRGVATGVSVGGPVTITATFKGVTGNTTLSVVNATLTGIVIQPATATVTVGTNLQFAAMAVYNNGLFTQDLTRQVKWSSDNKNIAIVSNGFYSRGLTTAVGKGSAHISATKPSTTGVTITPATITVQ